GARGHRRPRRGGHRRGRGPGSAAQPGLRLPKGPTHGHIDRLMMESVGWSGAPAGLMPRTGLTGQARYERSPRMKKAARGRKSAAKKNKPAVAKKAASKKPASGKKASTATKTSPSATTMGWGWPAFRYPLS